MAAPSPISIPSEGEFNMLPKMNILCCENCRKLKKVGGLRFKYNGIIIIMQQKKNEEIASLNT